MKNINYILLSVTLLSVYAVVHLVPSWIEGKIRTGVREALERERELYVTAPPSYLSYPRYSSPYGPNNRHDYYDDYYAHSYAEPFGDYAPKMYCHKVVEHTAFPLMGALVQIVILKDHAADRLNLVIFSGKPLLAEGTESLFCMKRSDYGRVERYYFPEDEKQKVRGRDYL